MLSWKDGWNFRKSRIIKKNIDMVNDKWMILLRILKSDFQLPSHPCHTIGMHFLYISVSHLYHTSSGLFRGFNAMLIQLWFMVQYIGFFCTDIKRPRYWSMRFIYSHIQTTRSSLTFFLQIKWEIKWNPNVYINQIWKKRIKISWLI